ncbi:MAG: biopolymer transporter ExbD [Pirellulaceae bacterium]|nr:biopolymer transporter ExbD [Pirellulaceae bacterium]
MRVKSHGENRSDGDLTPMIDMTFQLIAFFMVLINFTEADQNELIQLPTSELAKPPDTPFEHPIFIQLTETGDVILGGEEVPLTGLKPYMIREGEFLKLQKQNPKDATVIIRADANAPMGKVQEVIKTCQESKFEIFALRAEEEIQ